MHTMFRFLQLRTRVQVWLYDQPHVRLEGTIVGFDEYMNLVLEGTEEVVRGKGGVERRSAMGKLLLKGDNITAILGAGQSPSSAGAASVLTAAIQSAAGGGGSGGGVGGGSSSSSSSSSSSGSGSGSGSGSTAAPAAEAMSA